jgi:hypothetical protein
MAEQIDATEHSINATAQKTQVRTNKKQLIYKNQSQRNNTEVKCVSFVGFHTPCSKEVKEVRK